MADLIIGTLLLFFCLYYTILTNQLPGREIQGMVGVAFMPRLLTIVLASLALLLVIQGLRRWWRQPERSHLQDPTALLRPALALLTLLAYPLAMAYGGFLITTPIFFGTFTTIAGGRGVRRIFLTSLLATFAVYIGFHYLFQVPLPKFTLF